VKPPPTPTNEIDRAASPEPRGPSGLRERFEAALRCDPDTRADWLDAHCTSAVERHTIERMLEADALDAGQTIDRSVEVLLDRIGEDGDPAPPIGARIGPFVLLEKLGEGGSSIVFRAQRTQDDVVQQVALKVLRHHLYTHDERRRFRDERRALGQLRHAGIARLIEGGITESGTPYIALEFVQGETLLTHACRHRLDIDGRLRLFVDVCRAVEAAHRALIVHRDLKPSNVLVGVDGDVKLLDFGIAKLLDREDDDDATHTQRRAMTPAYAAPEQLRGGQVTTATDVYALGIMLCELVTGQRRSVGDTHTPSSDIDDANTPDLLPAPPARLRRLLRGDLDNIVLQATAEEPERRYASAGALADDIERHLASAPVAAHPPSRWYRAHKFVMRHRGGVITTAALVLAIFAALGIAVWQAHTARTEATRASAMRDFMVSAFREAQPGSPREGPPRITEVVEAAAARARADTTMHPGVRAELLGELGAVLREQGRLDPAQDILQWNYDQSRRDLGENDRLTLGAGLELLRLRFRADDEEGERRLADDLLARIPPSEPRLRSEVLMMSGVTSTRQRQFERAIGESREALALARDLDDPHLLSNALLAYGQTLLRSGDPLGASVAAEEALALTQARVGMRHVSVSAAHVNLSRIYRQAGDLPAAERHIQAALAIDDAVLPPDDARRALHLNAKVMILREQREFAAALAALTESLRINRLALGDDHPFVANDLLSIGTLRMGLGDFEGAVEPLRQALEVIEVAKGPASLQAAIMRRAYGEALAGAGDPGAAESEMERALATLEASPGQDPHEQALVWESLARLRIDRGEPEKALSAIAEIDRLLAGMAKPKSYWEGRSATLRASVMVMQGNGPAALELLEDADATLRSSADKDLELATEVQLQQARVAQLGGEPEAAAQSTARALAAIAALRNPPTRLTAMADALRARPGD
jgi:tetratricopeptide (TPR) repeat protein/tRNA A-37 threonylcarbamoyl transferase component Bud32